MIAFSSSSSLEEEEEDELFELLEDLDFLDAAEQQLALSCSPQSTGTSWTITGTGTDGGAS